MKNIRSITEKAKERIEKYYYEQKYRLQSALQYQRQDAARFGKEPALGTIEVVVITGILLTVALIFNQQIRSFSGKLFKSVFNDGRVISRIMD